MTVYEVPIIKCLGDTVEEDVEERCPDCTVTRLPHATAVVATNTPTNVVSPVQQDGDRLRHLRLRRAEPGVVASIAEAGFDTNIAGVAPTSEDYQRIIDGEVAAWASWSTPLAGLGHRRRFARFFNDESVEPTNNQPMTISLFTQENQPPIACHDQAGCVVSSA